jgi:YcaO-like protein with predicted kinase domain
MNSDLNITCKAFKLGSHRTVQPAETIARARAHLDTFGITRVANITGLDRIGVPVVMVCRPNARSSAVFHGKGLDLTAAKASGLMEAAETWHAENVELPLRYSTFGEISRSRQVATIKDIPGVSLGRFHENLPILWVEGYDMLCEESRWVPYETVHMNATIPEAPGSRCFSCSTNGLASGNSRLEALSHSLCEVIERDAISIWRQCDLQHKNSTRINLASVTDKTCRSLLEQISSAALELAVWNVTSDIGVPTFVCLASDRLEQIAHIGQGAGCHPTREIALLRALTECMQVRMTYIVGSREDLRPSDYLPATLESRKHAAHALMSSGAGSVDFDDRNRIEFEDFKDEVEWILSRLRSAGLAQAISVDLTKEEIGLAVVRVVVPGLEGSDHLPDYRPGPRARLIKRR